MWVWEAAQLVSPGHWNCPPLVTGRGISPPHMVRNGDISPKWVLVYCESQSAFPKNNEGRDQLIMTLWFHHTWFLWSPVVSQMIGQKCMLCDTPRFPMLLRWTKKYWRGREENGMKRFLLLISWVGWFDLGDTARVKNTYGGNRKLPEMRCMMWNSQTIDNEIIIKTNNHISILLFFWNLNIITLFKM